MTGPSSLYQGFNLWSQTQIQFYLIHDFAGNYWQMWPMRLQLWSRWRPQKNLEVEIKIAAVDRFLKPCSVFSFHTSYNVTPPSFQPTSTCLRGKEFKIPLNNESGLSLVLSTKPHFFKCIHSTPVINIFQILKGLNFIKKVTPFWNFIHAHQQKQRINKYKVNRYIHVSTF